MIFTNEDFSGIYGDEIRNAAADMANFRFKEWLAGEQTVFCRVDDGEWAADENEGFARATYKAKLVCIGLRKDPWPWGLDKA